MTAILHGGRALWTSRDLELLELDFSMVRIRLQRIGIVLQWNRQLSHLPPRSLRWESAMGVLAEKASDS